MMCQVRWGDNRLALYINNKRVNYMGLYQVSQLPGMVASYLGWWPATWDGGQLHVDARCTLAGLQEMDSIRTSYMYM